MRCFLFPRWVWTIFLGVILCGCRDEKQIRLLGEQIRGLERVEEQRSAQIEELNKQVRALEGERGRLKEEGEAMLPKVKAAEEALKALQEEFAKYKSQYKLSIRKRAPGMELGEVEVQGKRFEGVKVRQLTEEALIFVHEKGTTSVPLSQLKAELQTRLGYEMAAPFVSKGAGRGTIGAAGGAIAKNGVVVDGVEVATGMNGIRKNGSAPMAGGGAAVHLSANPQVNEVVREMAELGELIRMLEDAAAEDERAPSSGPSGGMPTVSAEGDKMATGKLNEAKALFAELEKRRQELEAQMRREPPR
jgi:outer membrane murein-binding lipoprotein Lpp